MKKISDGPVAIPRGHRRAVNKASRVQRVLEACRELINETGGTDFTMQTLAQRSGLSLATAYNLIGTKAAVLYLLLDGSLDDLAARQARLAELKTNSTVQAMTQVAVGFFCAEPSYYRPLMRFLLGVYEPERRPLFMTRALAYWRVAAEGDRSEDLATALHISFTGALDLWVHGEIGDAEFESLMLNQATLLLLAIRGKVAEIPPE